MTQWKIQVLLLTILIVAFSTGSGIFAYAQENSDNLNSSDSDEITPLPEIEEPVTSDEPSDDEGMIVRALEFQGNVRISDEQILAVMVTRPGREFSFNELDKDMESIANMGYFQVPPKYNAVPLTDGVKIIVFLKENPLFSGLEITITGPGLFTVEELEAMFEYDKGEILALPRLIENYEKIEAAYRAKGYTAASIVAADYDDDGIVYVEINEGIIKEIRVEGNTKTKDIVILREISLNPGDVFNAIRFRRDLENIFTLQLFEDISVDWELTENEQIIVIIQVTEARTGQFGFGAGYSSQDGFLGTFSYTEKNFRGRGQRVNLLGQIGGPNPDFMLSYYMPQIDKKRTSMTTDIFMMSSTDRIRNTDDPDVFTKFTTQRTGGSLSFTRPIRETVSVTTKLSFLDGNIDVEEGSLTVDQFEDYARRGLIEGTSNSLLLGVSKDTRDFVLDPATGYLASITGTYYGGILGGDFNAIKGVVEYRTYRNLNPQADELVTGIDPSRFHKNTVIAFRVLLGGADGDLSLFDSFKIGGADSVRGADDALHTGDKALLSNLEFRFPLVSNLSAAMFLDNGAAAPPGETLGSQKFTTSVGGGVRYRIPFFGIAPLRLDYGYDLTNNSSRITFGFGQLF